MNPKSKYNHSFTPKQMEFFAEEEIVSVIPNTKINDLKLISSEIKFLPGAQVNVPLWLAISLKQRKKCTIILPVWMNLCKLFLLWLLSC